MHATQEYTGGIELPNFEAAMAHKPFLHVLAEIIQDHNSEKDACGESSTASSSSSPSSPSPPIPQALRASPAPSLTLTPPTPDPENPTFPPGLGRSFPPCPVIPEDVESNTEAGDAFLEEMNAWMDAVRAWLQQTERR